MARVEIEVDGGQAGGVIGFFATGSGATPGLDFPPFTPSRRSLRIPSQRLAGRKRGLENLCH